MEDTFYNTELKNKKTSQRGKKKNLTTVEREQYIKERKEHCRASVRVMSILCVSVRNSFGITAVRAGAAGAAAPRLRGAAAAEPGRASRGSRAGFLCRKRGSEAVTCKELN